MIKILHFPYSRLSFHLLQGFPNDRDNERFEQELGVRISGFPGSHVVDGSIDVIKHEFVEASKFWWNHQLTKRGLKQLAYNA